ncbi:MAG: MFS transporter [Chloroflexota bacterium]|nr:MFS transporter [Chloroflexota bacterium]
MPPSTRTDHPTPVMQTRSATRLVATIGAAIGLCIMGDSLMYSILPLQAPHLGISLPLVGILLSANRLVRLLSNKWAGGIFERYGTKWPFFASVLVGLLSTAFYGIPAGFIVFLLARMSWGVAWSGLRQGGYAAVWTGSAATRGRLTGLLWGLVRLGSAIGVFAGGLLYDRAGYGAAITAVVAVGLLAIPTAYLVRWPASVEEPNHPPTSVEEDNAQVSWRQLAAAAFRSPVHRWLTLGSFFVYLLSGVVVSTTSVFLAARFDAGSGAFIFGLGIAALTGMIHAARWLADLALGPLVGWLSDYVGQANTLATLGVLMVAALAAASSLPPVAATLCIFAALLIDGALHIVVSAAASGAALRSDRPHVFVAAFATVSDAGSALGPLAAFTLAASVQRLPAVYITASCVLMLVLWQYWRTERSAAVPK